MTEGVTLLWGTRVSLLLVTVKAFDFLSCLWEELLILGAEGRGVVSASFSASLGMLLVFMFKS